MTEQELYEKARHRASERNIHVNSRGFDDGLCLADVRKTMGNQEPFEVILSEDNYTFGLICGMLAKVEAVKGKAYQASFCKRGLKGIFNNMERKWDRLDAIITRGGESNSTESMMTNAADLAVYAIKLMAWQAEMKPQEFQDWVKEVQGLK